MDKCLIIEKLESKISKENIYIDEPMKKHTSFKIGGNADLFVKAKNTNEIEHVISVSKQLNIPLTILGNGTNVLVKDNGIRGIVLKICNEDLKINRLEDGAIVEVGAGMVNAKLAQILLKEELSGFEFAAGIPGTIGGAIKMNAGAYGSEMKNIVIDVTYIDLNDDKIKIVSNEEAKFEYRHSIFFDKKAVIIGARLKFLNGKSQEIAKIMEENLISRKAKQPIDKPSAGSTFKRGNDFITAKVIDDAGLKGTKIGDAMVSEKHAGFIVNNGNATAKDVIDLINIVKEKVLEKENKKIELEIEIIGE